jgi:hypothetical protein
VTEQPPTPEDVPASLEGDTDPATVGSEPTQAGVAPTKDAVAPKPQDAPPAETPTVVDAPPPAAAPPPPAVEPPPPPPPVEPPPAVVEPPPPPPAAPPPSFPTDSVPAAVPRDRPEIPIAAAFVGGLVLALILKRLAR